MTSAEKPALNKFIIVDNLTKYSHAQGYERVKRALNGLRKAAPVLPERGLSARYREVLPMGYAATMEAMGRVNGILNAKSILNWDDIHRHALLVKATGAGSTP